MHGYEVHVLQQKGKFRGKEVEGEREFVFFYSSLKATLQKAVEIVTSQCDDTNMERYLERYAEIVEGIEGRWHS